MSARNWALVVVLAAALSRESEAQIYRWDSGEVIPGTQGITPGPGAQLDQLDLQAADLFGIDLTGARFDGSNLARAQLTHSNLINATLSGAVLNGASLATTGLTAAQLASTASYQAKNLRGIILGGNDLSGWDLTGQNLANASLVGNLSNAMLDGALVTGVIFSNSLTREQLYSTASYQQKSLQRIGLQGHDASGWDLGHQDLTGADLSYATFTNANLQASTLTNARLNGSRLIDANLAAANLANAGLSEATLTNASLAGAIVTGTAFHGITSRGFTQAQLASTASYQAKNLTGIGLGSNDLTSWDLMGQNLTNADLSQSTLTDANLSGAVVAGANFGGTAITHAQLASTASYQAKNLTGIQLSFNDLTGWDFGGQNLTGAHFYGSAFANVELTSAVVRGTRLSGLTAKGFTASQLYSTASYQAKNLQGIGLQNNDLTGWDLRGQGLGEANLYAATLSNADLEGADLTGAYLLEATLTGADLSGAIVAGARLIGVRGLTQDQIYSTASYRQKNLQGIELDSSSSGWDFSSQNLRHARLVGALAKSSFAGAILDHAEFTGGQGAELTGSDFSRSSLRYADLRHADLTNASFVEANLFGADLRGAVGFVPGPSASLRNTIMPNYELMGLEVLAGETFVYDTRWRLCLDCLDVPKIRVTNHASIADTAVLEVVVHGFKQSIISTPMQFDSSIPISLAGTLRVRMPGALTEEFVGLNVDLFDWPGLLALENRFDTVEFPFGGRWDLSRLYTTGEVTLIGVPEPAGAGLLAVAATLHCARRSRRLPMRRSGKSKRVRACAGICAMAAAVFQLAAPLAWSQTVDLTEASIVDLNRAFSIGSLTSERLVELYLERIAAYEHAGPNINSIVALNSDVISTARALDEERRTAGPRSLLHGIPVVIKDLIDVAGLPTSGGTKALQNSIPPDDAFVVDRLRAAGAIILGKTNTDEFGEGVRGWSTVLGQTLNPYDPRRVAGGSSAGTGAAVNASFATAGLGTDNWGSIRLPAAWNGLVGLKPTLGLVSRDGTMVQTLDRDNLGPMGRSVADVAIMLDAIAGVDAADPQTAVSLGRIPASYVASLSPHGLQGVRIGVIRTYVNNAGRPMSTIIDAALEEMRLAGAEIVDNFTFSPQPDFARSFYQGFEHHMNNYLESLGPSAPIKTVQELIASNEYSSHLKAPNGLFGLLRGDIPPDDDPLNATVLAHRAEVAQGLSEALDAQQLDFVVYPTASDFPAFAPAHPFFPSNRTWINLNLAPLLGLPAITAPVGFTAQGLPVGLEIMGREFTEPELLSAAYALELRINARKSPSSTPPLAGEVLAAPSVADFNGDNRVDDVDLAAWDINYGLAADARNPQGDADYDGNVDGGDLLLWQRQSAMNTSVAASPGEAPEPTAATCLTTMALVALGLCRPAVNRRR